MSRRRKHAPPPYEAAITLRLTLVCPVDEQHQLGVIKRDVVGDHLYGAYPSGRRRHFRPGNDSVPIRRDPPALAGRRPGAPDWPCGDTGGRLRWTCPACVKAGLWEDRQVRYDRVAELLDAMRDALVPSLRVRLDPDELASRVAGLRARARQHNV